ncbi:hypothetical protein BRADI_1g76046v3 [Brachypodium distachyon]|uniref:Uncharacterized protein n=1 Tax=Brachypodium distachyon TaxID=15368 RepID=A0A0Q3LKF4_BRADI|nr:hypothetical protein BRADI_1g76046v3 [Brachypodium distachyon]
MHRSYLYAPRPHKTRLLIISSGRSDRHGAARPAFRCIQAGLSLEPWARQAGC